MPDYESGGRRFESCQAGFFECEGRKAKCGVAPSEFIRARSSAEQERQFPKLEDAGSNPAGLMRKCGVRSAEWEVDQ